MFRNIIYQHKKSLKCVPSVLLRKNLSSIILGVNHLKFYQHLSYRNEKFIPKEDQNYFKLRINKNPKLAFEFSTRCTERSSEDTTGGSNLECNNNSLGANEIHILNEDSELQSLLDDIMKDFDAVPPPPSKPPGSKVCQDSLPESESSDTNESRSIEITNDKDEKMTIKETMLPQKISLCISTPVSIESNDVSEKNGSVINLDDLMIMLKKENCKDIAVIKIPLHLAYADYMVIATALSYRHLKACVENVCKLHKARKGSEQRFLSVEGKECKDWKVIDMGSIVLHIFISNVREHYNIETLWTVGEAFDDLSHIQQTKEENLLEQHTYYIDNVQAKANSL